MAIDITQLPGMGGETGGIVAHAVQTIENAVLCVTTGSLFDCFSAIVNFALSVFDIFISIFSGRPKVGIDSASDDTALFFIPSSNPVISLWGVGIRDLESQGIPTSASGGAGYTAQINLATAVLHDLQKQFDGSNAGKAILNGVPVSGQQIFDLYHTLGFQTHNPDSNSNSIQQRIILDQLYLQLVNLRLIDPNTGFPPPPGTILPPPPPPPPPPPTLPPPPLEFDTPGQDEFQDCCDETQASLQAVINAINGLATGSSGVTDSTCCTNVVNAISAVVTQLGKLALILPTIGSTTIDLSPVASAIDGVTAAINAAAAAPAKPIDVTILNWPAAGGGTSGATDVTPIVEQLKNLVREGDVKQGVLDYLTKQGFMTGADAQVIAGADWADAIVGVFRTYGWNALTWALSLVGITWTGTKFNFSLASFEGAIAGDFAGAVKDALTIGSAPLYPEIKGIIAGVVAQLQPTGPTQPGWASVDSELLIAKTLSPILIINAVSWLASYFGWEISENLKEYVDIASELVGLAEVKEVEVGQLMQAGPIAAARIRARTLYRQTLPGVGQTVNQHARGILGTGTAKRELALQGFNDEFHNQLLTAGFSGIAPRQLIRLLPTGLFTDADLRDEMTFSGMRHVSQARILAAAPYIATETWRAQLRSALESEFAAGLLSEAQLVNALDSAEHNTSRTFLILDRVRSQEAVKIATALESEYNTMYQAGLIDQPTYHANLSGMGLQQWKIDALAGVADARRAATLQRQLLAQERALVRATAAEERKAAMAAFRTGTINAPALAAALVATGLNATQAAAWVSLAQLQSIGNERWIYGMQKTPADAELLRKRVTALTDQAKKQLIDMPTFQTQLKALGLPAHVINALSATVAATITPKLSEFVIDVQTS